MSRLIEGLSSLGVKAVAIANLVKHDMISRLFGGLLVSLATIIEIALILFTRLALDCGGYFFTSAKLRQ